jgi:hypothetical protein
VLVATHHATNLVNSNSLGIANNANSTVKRLTCVLCQMQGIKIAFSVSLFVDVVLSAVVVTQQFRNGVQLRELQHFNTARPAVAPTRNSHWVRSTHYVTLIKSSLQATIIAFELSTCT